ncbi:MAG: hypothetical protein ABIV21_09375, partial [Pyrinomonadaceae bacterium]
MGHKPLKNFRLSKADLKAIIFLLITAAVTTYASPGGLDLTFGQGGRVFTNIGIFEPGNKPLYPLLFSTVVQTDGKILVGGGYWEDAISEYYGSFMVRYMPDGTPDSSFGNNGKVVFRTDYDFATDIVLQPDGKIVTIGSTVRRYTSSGMVDTTFGNGGAAPMPTNEGHAITLQPDGKIVGFGTTYGFTGPFRAVLFRLNGNGTPDTSFGPAGNGAVTINGYTTESVEVFVKSDGKVLVVGGIRDKNGISGDVLLARYNSNGTLDQTFGTGGMVRHRVNDRGSYASGAALQADGKIVVTGQTFFEKTDNTFF